MDSGGSSLWLIQAAMIVFAVVLVVVFALVINPPNQLVHRMGKPEKDSGAEKS